MSLCPSPDQVSKLDRTLSVLLSSKIVAILRAKNSRVALQRGIELVSLGCKSIEVTCDSQDFEWLLTELVQSVGDRCVVGIGTCERPDQLDTAVRCGAHFALAPFRPTWDFVSSCHQRGVLAVPAAFSPQEIYESYLAGAKLIKVFPAQLWTPKLLKQIKAVGLFGKCNLLPSGGVAPEMVQEWLDAGAAVVGMGSNLVGGDVRVSSTDHKKLEIARRQWQEKGRQRAQLVFSEVSKYLSLSEGGSQPHSTYVQSSL